MGAEQFDRRIILCSCAFKPVCYKSIYTSRLETVDDAQRFSFLQKHEMDGISQELRHLMYATTLIASFVFASHLFVFKSARICTTFPFPALQIGRSLISAKLDTP